MKPPGAIILGNEYQALGLLRQLSKAGISCVLIDQDRYGPALFSKYNDKFYVSPKYTSFEFWPWLKKLAESKGYLGWIIIPTDDEQVRQLAENYEEVLCIFKYAGLPWNEYKKIYDKRLAHEWVSQIGIESPKSFVPKSRTEIDKHGLKYPFIVKPAVKKIYKNYSNKKAITINNNEELKDVVNFQLKEVPIEDLIFQEIVSGGGKQQWSYAGFFVNGEPIAAFTACRLRQHPPDYGRASTFVSAIHNEEVENLSKKIIQNLNFTGLAEIEWKKDAVDNKLKFFEINARSWGWHSISEKVVGNISKMLYDYLTSGTLHLITPKYGASWVKWITDIPVVLHLWKSGELRFNEYFKGLRTNLVSCEWDLKDPKPFLFQIFLLPYLIAKRGY